MTKEQGRRLPMWAYVHDVDLAGNHLADVLVAAGMDVMASWEYRDVQREFGQTVADVWYAWRAIMNWRDQSKVGWRNVCEVCGNPTNDNQFCSAGCASEYNAQRIADMNSGQ